MRVSRVQCLVFPENNSQVTVTDVCITCDEDARVVLRRWGAAGLPAVPPAHLPGQGAETATGHILRPVETASAKQTQHSRRGHTGSHTQLHVQKQSFSKGQINSPKHNLMIVWTGTCILPVSSLNPRQMILDPNPADAI